MILFETVVTISPWPHGQKASSQFATSATCRDRIDLHYPRPSVCNSLFCWASPQQGGRIFVVALGAYFIHERLKNWKISQCAITVINRKKRVTESSYCYVSGPDRRPLYLQMGEYRLPLALV